MNPFHQYLERQLTERFKKRPVLVWYDPRKEFEPFVDALPTQGDPENGIYRVTIGDLTVSLARFEGSFFGIKAAVEPLVDKDHPDPLLLYIPGASRDRKGSVLMELEKGGECFEWQLKRLARFCLLEKGDSDGIIDNLLAPEHITYQDIMGFLTRETGEVPSLLKMLFDGVKENSILLARWLCDPDMDEKSLPKGCKRNCFFFCPPAWDWNCQTQPLWRRPGKRSFGTFW